MDIEDQEKIFIEIYTECDNDSTNNVQVSVLLSYIEPYIDSSSLHFEELKNTLDPGNVNPFIDKQTFLNAMMSWSDKFKNEVDFNFNNEEISRQSTPTKNLRVDYDGLNLSSISAYSLTGSVLSTIDVNILQDQNNELQHQNKKLSECLDDVKYQLTGLEEQNVSLQNEVERINKNCQADQKLIKTLQTKCAEYEREKEEHTKIINENKINCENLISIKRVKVELENRIKELETQNKAHIEVIEKLSDLCVEKDEANKKLQKESDERDAEVLRIQEREAEWRQKCAQNELNVKKCIAESNDLKNHIQSLEMLLKKDDDQNSLKMDHFEPDSPSPSSDKYKSISSSSENNEDNEAAAAEEDEDDCCLVVKQGEPVSPHPHESLHSELSHISTTTGCFNSCEHRINQLEDEIGRLCDQLQEANEELKLLKSVKQELVASRNTTDSLTIELNQLKVSLEATQKEKQQLVIESKQMSSKLSYYKVINKNLKIQLNAKLKEIIMVRKKLTEKETEMMDLEKEMHEKVALKENENKCLAEDAANLKEANCRLMNEMCSVERAAKLERKRNTRTDLNCRINELEEQLEQARDKCQHLLSTIGGLTSDKQQLVSKLELLENTECGKRKIESLESKLHKYRRKLTDLENQILCKTRDAHDTLLRNEGLSVELNKANDRYATLMAHIDDIRIAVHSHKDLLRMTTYYTSDVWKDIIKDIIKDMDTTPDLDPYLKLTIAAGPLQDEINLLNTQIHVTIILLKTFAKIKNKMTMTLINEESGQKMWTSTPTPTPSSNKIDVRKLYNPHESNNESLLSKLSPKRFFLKPPTLVLKSKSKTHFVFPPPPMSPECSRQNQSEPEEMQQINVAVLENVKQLKLTNNNNDDEKISINTIIMSDDMHTAECAVPLQTEQNNEKQEEQSSSSAAASAPFLKSNETENKVTITASSINSTFTKTYNDSFIEKILMEEKIDDPVAKIEETQIFDNDNDNDDNNELSENSDGSESDSRSSKDNLDVDADVDDVDVENAKKKKKLKKERKIRKEEEIIKERLARQVRSMSEGAAVVHQLSKDGDVTVFPNLQDNALDALGLMTSEQSKERLTEEEIELKFQTLSLAFNIDAVTIRDRLERQQRQRDQAEENLGAEVARFISAVHRLHPLCVDAETTELVTSLLDRLQVIVKATHRISTSAEIFGSVQQEWRIAETVNLMLSHLRNLIKQRDAARRQLKITKRMLQETTSTSTTSVLKKPVTTTVTRRLTINTATVVNGRIGGQGGMPLRRASIAVIPRPMDSPSVAAAPMLPLRQVTAVRRTSDERQEPLPKPWDCKRAQEQWSQERKTPRPPLLSRPSRLDINPELTKIQEGSIESFTSDEHQIENSEEDENIQFEISSVDEKIIIDGHENINLKLIKKILKQCWQVAVRVFNHWAENGTLHELCFIGTTVCFTVALILLSNTLVAIELARDGVHTPVPWHWLTWDEFSSLFYKKQ